MLPLPVRRLHAVALGGVRLAGDEPGAMLEEERAAPPDEWPGEDDPPGGAAEEENCVAAPTPASPTQTKRSDRVRCDEAIDTRTLAVLKSLDNASPRLLKIVEIQEATELSKQTVTNAIQMLIDRRLAERPRPGALRLVPKLQPRQGRHAEGARRRGDAG